MPAHNPNEVREAFNNHAAMLHFSQIPDPVPTATMGSIYNGLDFNKDCQTIYLLMKHDLESATVPHVDPDDLLNTMLNFSGWYESDSRSLAA